MSLPSPLPLVAKAPVVPVVALEAVRNIAAEVEGAIVGAGTVIERAQIEASLEAGATFLVSPGTTPELAAAFAETQIPVMAGCATVSEAMRLAQLGFEVLKFFPAEASGGAAFLKSIAGPLPHLRFCPTGGIGPGNVADYLKLPNVVAVGGSWVVPQDAIRAGDFGRVRELARAASQLKRAATFA